MYKNESIVIWNGNSKQGPVAFSDLLRQLPPSFHRVESIDVHPVAGRTISLTLLFLVYDQLLAYKLIKAHCWSVFQEV